MLRFTSGIYCSFLFVWLFTTTPARAQGLSAPTLQATPAEGHTVALRWTDAEGYRTNSIFRKSGESDWAQVVELGEANSYWDRTTVSGVSYTYRLQAVTLDGRFAFSNEASATTDGATLYPPARPGLFANAVSHTSVRLQVTGIETGQTQYILERQKPNSEWTQIAVLGGLATEYLDTGLTPASQYFYRVRGSNHAGFSPYASALTVTFYDPTIIPPEPELLAHPYTDTANTLVWNFLNEATGFRLESKTGASGSWIEITNVPAEVTFVIHEHLTPSTEYFYRIRAYNAAGLSEYSKGAAVSTYPPPPSSPELRGIPISYKEIELRWTDVLTNCCTNPEYIGYKLEAWNGNAWRDLTFAGVDDTNYFVRGLEPGAEYSYRIAARHPLASEWSTNTVRTMDPPPIAPSAPVFYADPYSAAAVQLKWLDVELETEYRIERENFPGGGVWQQIAIAPANTTSYRDIDLQPGTSYVYRIRAANSFDASAYSHEAAATTPLLPGPPSLKAEAVSATAISLLVAPAAGGVQYQLQRLTRTGEWDVIYETNSAPFGFADTGLNPLTSYQYRAASRLDERFPARAYSAEVIVRTPGNLTGDIVIRSIAPVDFGANFRLRLTGSNGQRFKVQYTSDLISWSDATDALTLTADMEIPILSAGNTAFYRTIKVD